MSGDVTITIEGASELDAVLKMLPAEIEQRVTANALIAGARLVAAAMKASAPIGAAAHVYRHRKKGKFTGDLTIRQPGYGKSQIRARMATAKDLALLGGITSKTMPGFWRSSAAAELKSIAAQKLVALAGVSRRAFYLGFVEYGHAIKTHGTSGARRTIGHVPARPFLRPAWEGSKMAALDAIGQKLGTGIEKAALRLAGTYRKSGLSKRGRTFIKL